LFMKEPRRSISWLCRYPFLLKFPGGQSATMRGLQRKAEVTAPVCCNQIPGGEPEENIFTGFERA